MSEINNQSSQSSPFSQDSIKEWVLHWNL